MKRVLWTALLTVATAGAAALAGRAAAAAWRRATAEDPPDVPRWLTWVVGKPLRTSLTSALQP